MYSVVVRIMTSQKQKPSQDTRFLGQMRTCAVSGGMFVCLCVCKFVVLLGVEDWPHD